MHATQHSFAGSCSHLQTVEAAAPVTPQCLSCLAEGLRSVALRMCLACGTVGCCDSSAGQHARGHFETTGHPIIQSIEPGQAWAWCYVDEAYLSPVASAGVAGG
jgi:monovalent cation/hydrogen antiporter